MVDLELSNWINLGILIVAGLVGILAWLGACNAAKEARKSQDEANKAAKRSASAAERANSIQTDILKIEESRQAEAAAESRRAALTAGILEKDAFHFDEPTKELYLVIRNTGASCARDIEVLVDDCPLNDYREFPTKIPSDAHIGPQGDLELVFWLTASGKLKCPFRVALSWSDDSGQRNSWSSTLSW